MTFVAELSDDGAAFKCIITNDMGFITSDSGLLTVTETLDFVCPIDAVKALIKKIKGLELHKGTENSLVAKLNAALKSLNKNRDKQLSGCINEMKAQTGKKIETDTALELIKDVESIIENIRNNVC